MKQWIRKMYESSVIRYIFFGGCTTMVNLVSFFILRKLKVELNIANIISIILAILFAYVVNSKYVFQDKCETLKDHVQCVITDIEMPMMDGHRLTKLIKSDDETKDIPVIIFSSLVNDDMKKKGDALGADAQLSKPEIGNLVKVIDELVG